jgi:PKD repeat protein
MYGHLKISQHAHSGKLRPHEHTSYLPLAILILGVGLMLGIFSFANFANAATPYTGPEAGSVGLTGTMPEPPPKEAAVISAPTNLQHFSTSPITVSGTCPDGTLVEIYKNAILAGSTPCSNGKFSVQVDLLFGQNILKARVYDVLNQAGPESNAVTVFYDAGFPQAASLSSLNFSGAQLILYTDAAYRGSFPQQQLNVPVTVIGGTAPFAINVQWGDSSNNVVSRSDNTTFNTAHAYKKPGTYKITLQGSDSKKLVAFLSVAAIVNGKPDVAVAGATKPPSSKLLLLWPILAVSATLVASFWMGERREKKILNKVMQTQQTPAFGTAASSQVTS